MKDLPKTLTAYKQTPEFDRASVPPGLLKSHSTKAGTWAKIIVLEGAMTYRILQPEMEEIELNPDLFGVVEPTVEHEIEPQEGTRFYVEFYR